MNITHPMTHKILSEIRKKPGFRYLILEGGTRSGKTYNILDVIKLMSYASKKKNELRPFSIITDTLPRIKKGALHDFNNILTKDNIINQFNPNKSEHYFISPSNYKIEFEGLENELKALGAEREHLFINEAYRVKWKVAEQLFVRTRDKIFIDFNPVSKFWVHNEILGKYPDDKVIYIHSTYKDNIEYLTEAQIQDIENKRPVYDDKQQLISGDPLWWRVYGEGLPGVAEGIVFDTPVEYLNTEPDGVKWIAFGLDFGFSVFYTSLVKVGILRDTLVIKECLYEKGLLTVKGSGNNPSIQLRFEQLGITKQDKIICDSANKRDISALLDAGYNCFGAVKKDIVFGINEMKRYSKIILISNKSDELPGIKHEFRNYVWEVNAKGEFTGQPIDDYNDGIDAARYVVEYKSLKLI